MLRAELLLMNRQIALSILLFCLPALAELKPATRQAFDHYIKVAEARMQPTLQPGQPFLWIDSLDTARKNEIIARLRKGEVVTNKLVEKDKGSEINIPSGMVHHWIGTVFVPGTNVAKALALLQDYNHHRDLYKPEVVDSRLISREGNQFKAFLRFYKKKVIGVTLNTEHLADYETLSSSRAYSISRTTKVAEVENAGEKDEREKPIGHDNGFMWALNSYWRLEEKDGGVYIQCEAITLTRDIPMLLSAIIKPFVTEVPRESLFTTLNSTRQGLTSGIRAQR